MNGDFNRKLLQGRAFNPVLTRGNFLQKGSFIMPLSFLNIALQAFGNIGLSIHSNGGIRFTASSMTQWTNIPLKKKYPLEFMRGFV